MPRPLRSGFSIVDPYLTLGEALRQPPLEKDFWVIPMYGDQFACFTRQDLLSVADWLARRNQDPETLPLGFLAEDYTRPGVTPHTSKEEMFLLAGPDAPGNGVFVVLDEAGAAAGLFFTTLTHREAKGLHPDFVQELLNRLGTPAHAEPGGRDEMPLEAADDEPHPAGPETAIPKNGGGKHDQERRVQVQVHRADGPEPVLLAKAFAAGQPHTLLVWVGLPRLDALVSPKSIDDQLPPGQDKYTLDLTFREPYHCPQPLSGCLDLPAGQTDSTYCQFNVPVRADVPVFCGRLQVGYQGRTLQTLLLSGQVLADPEQAGPDDRIQLTLEAELHNELDDLSSVQPVTVCLLQEADGLNILGEGEPLFFEISGQEASLKQLRARLSEITQNPDQFAQLDSPDTQDLLRTLARHGRMLYELIAGEIGADHPLFLPETKRIQLLSASDEIFPLETVYVFDGSLSPTAALCPQAAEALRLGHCEHCEHLSITAARRIICPLRFLGLSKIIERQKISGKTMRELKRGQRSNPSSAGQTLAPLRSVVYGHSAKVAKDDIKTLQTALSQHAQVAVPANDWDGWPEAIRTHTPTLLLIVPHTLEKDAFMNLEISKESDLPVDSISEEYVRAQPDVHPLVLMLGCSTAIAEVPFEGCAPQFRDSGAALTVTTLTPVLGRHVVPIACTLLAELKQAAENQRTFGEALLRTRQQALAEGYPTVLALVADGNIDWKITA